MKPTPFDYHAPSSVDEALQLAATLENAKLLAGGQTLMPMMNFRFLMPSHVIDLNAVGELAGISTSGGDTISIGAMTRQRDIERSELVQRKAPLLPEAYALVSHRQIRNRGTLGGSLCHLDPSSEQPCFLAAQGARLIVRSLRGERAVSVHDWALNYLTPALEADELLVRIDVDTWPDGHGWSFTEYARRQGDYAIVGVAALVTCDADRRIKRVALALCGVAAGPVRLFDAERSLIGLPMDNQALDLAGDAAREIDALSDAHVSSDYRRHLAGVLVRRAISTAFSRTKPAAT